MSQPAPKSDLLRQYVIVGLAGFAAGMIGFLVFITWLMWRIAGPDTPWYDLLHIAVNGLLLSVIAGLAVAAGGIWLMDLFHRGREMERCMRCGRPRRGLRRCDCADDSEARFRSP